jgi:hypothetical protein
MTDEAGLLRRIIERIVEHELEQADVEPREFRRQRARHVADQICEQMRSAGIEAKLTVSRWPQGEDC